MTNPLRTILDRYPAATWVVPTMFDDLKSCVDDVDRLLAKVAARETHIQQLIDEREERDYCPACDREGATAGAVITDLEFHQCAREARLQAAVDQGNLLLDAAIIENRKLKDAIAPTWRTPEDAVLFQSTEDFVRHARNADAVASEADTLRPVRADAAASRSTDVPHDVIQVPRIDGPTVPLCWKLSRAMDNCDRRRFHDGDCSWGPEDAAASRAQPEWRCFHCDEVFTEEAEAREHFGPEMSSVPACRLSAEDVRQLRALEMLITKTRLEVDHFANYSRCWHEAESERVRLIGNRAWHQELDYREGEKLTLQERVRELEALASRAPSPQDVETIKELLHDLGSTPKAATLDAAWPRLFSLLRRVVDASEDHKRALDRTDGPEDRGISAANIRALIADWRNVPNATVAECAENLEDILTGKFSYPATSAAVVPVISEVESRPLPEFTDGDLSHILQAIYHGTKEQPESYSGLMTDPTDAPTPATEPK